MLTEPTLDKLKELALYGMADAFLAQGTQPSTTTLAFEERFGLLVDAEWLHRQNKRTRRRLTEAKLRLAQASLEDVDASPARGLEKGTVARLATCAFIGEHLNCLVTGQTGTGKTFLACAIAQQACRRGFRALYRRAARLYEEIALARADGTYAKLLARFTRFHVLVIDDFGIGTLREHDRQALLDVLEDRYGRLSTVITSQLPTKAWHDYIGDPTIADSICDRVMHNAYKLELKGPSRRRAEEKPEKET